MVAYNISILAEGLHFSALVNNMDSMLEIIAGKATDQWQMREWNMQFYLWLIWAHISRTKNYRVCGIEKCVVFTQPTIAACITVT